MKKDSLHWKHFLWKIAIYHPHVIIQRLETRLLARGILSQPPPPTQTAFTEHLWRVSNVLNTYRPGDILSCQQPGTENSSIELTDLWKVMLLVKWGIQEQTPVSRLESYSLKVLYFSCFIF